MNLENNKNARIAGTDYRRRGKATGRIRNVWNILLTLEPFIIFLKKFVVDPSRYCIIMVTYKMLQKFANVFLQNKVYQYVLTTFLLNQIFDKHRFITYYLSGTYNINIKK